MFWVRTIPMRSDSQGKPLVCPSFREWAAEGCPGWKPVKYMDARIPEGGQPYVEPPTWGQLAASQGEE